MASFSEREGYKQITGVVQAESMDVPLRVALWNAFVEAYFHHFDDYADVQGDAHQAFLRELWKRQGLPVDTIGDVGWRIRDDLRKLYNSLQWHEVYTFLENVVSATPEKWVVSAHVFMHECNIGMEREGSAYRFIGATVGTITNEMEVQAIDQAIAGSAPAKGVSLHLQKAAEHLFDRDSPDYPNSIKESISAVESLCGRIVSKKATLGECIKVLGERVPMHPAYREAFNKLYGWTNDASGIRHGLADDSTVDATDAKFMLITCSAFVNFLLARASDAGINIEG